MSYGRKVLEFTNFIEIREEKEMEKEILEQNKLLKGLLVVMVELLPKHTTGCYSWKTHPSYGDQYCNCKIGEIREKVRGLL